jgi:hypothetical protein
MDDCCMASAPPEFGAMVVSGGNALNIADDSITTDQSGTADAKPRGP